MRGIKIPFNSHVLRGSRHRLPSESFREHANQLEVSMAASSYSVRATPPQPGETAPEFELPDFTGATQRLSNLCAASPLVLVFYRGHW
jgi:hypothetical protein